MSLEKSPKSFRAKFPRPNCGQNVWAKCVGKLWANLGQEMLYDGDISGDDEYTLETLQAAAVEILGSPSGKDEDFNYLLEIMDQQFEDSNPGAARRPQLLLAPLSVSVWLAAFDPDLFEPCLRDVYSKHTAKVAGASLKAAEGILDAAEGEAATGAETRAGAITSCGAKRVRRYSKEKAKRVRVRQSQAAAKEKEAAALQATEGHAVLQAANKQMQAAGLKEAKQKQAATLQAAYEEHGKGNRQCDDAFTRDSDDAFTRDNTTGTGPAAAGGLPLKLDPQIALLCSAGITTLASEDVQVVPAEAADIATAAVEPTLEKCLGCGKSKRNEDLCQAGECRECCLGKSCMTVHSPRARDNNAAMQPSQHRCDPDWPGGDPPPPTDDDTTEEEFPAQPLG